MNLSNDLSVDKELFTPINIYIYIFIYMNITFILELTLSEDGYTNPNLENCVYDTSGNYKIKNNYYKIHSRNTNDYMLYDKNNNLILDIFWFVNNDTFIPVQGHLLDNCGVITLGSIYEYDPNSTRLIIKNIYLNYFNDEKTKSI